MNLAVSGFTANLGWSNPATKAKETATPPPKEQVQEKELPPLGGATKRRRLRQVDRICLRSLKVGLKDAAGYTLHIAAPGSDRSQYWACSEVFNTMNPVWLLEKLATNVGALHSVYLRAVSASGELLWEAALNLPDMEPLCEDLDHYEPLIPPNTVLLRLELVKDKFFWLADARVVKALNGEKVFEPSAGGGRQRQQKQVTASQICQHGQVVSASLQRWSDYRRQSGALAEGIADRLRRKQEVIINRTRLEERREAVAQLKAKAEARRKEVSALRDSVSSTRVENAERHQQLDKLRSTFSTAQERLQQGVSELPQKYDDLRFLYQQARCRRIRMMRDMQNIYPIENHTNYRTIHGFCLPSIDMLNRQDLREEENFSTALGFLAHLVVVLARTLEVPLRIRIRNAGSSRSSLQDPSEAEKEKPLEEWPLYYGQGRQKGRFEQALRLLKDCLNQFLYSRGYFDEKRREDSCFLERLETILKNEMYGVDQPF